MRTKCFLVASHHVDKDLVGEQDETYKARNPFQSTLSDCCIVIRPKISPSDDDTEKYGGDQLDLVAEVVDVEEEAGEDGVVGLGKDREEDKGGLDTAGQVAAGDEEKDRIGDVATLLTFLLPVEEYHDDGQAKKEAKDNTERCDDIDQQRC